MEARVPEPHQAEWLSLINYQLRVAREQVEMPSPVNALAISSVQDAVESMLSLAAEVLGANVKSRADFLQLFDAVNAELPIDASISGMRTSANALNNARVGFKHHGNRADERTLVRHLFNGEEIVDTLCRGVFSISISEVSLLAFIRNETVRKRMEAASSAFAGDDLRAAMQHLWIAFNDLIHDFESTKSLRPGRSLFITKPAFPPRGTDFGLRTFEGHATEWLENLDRWVRMLAIGVDTRRYAYFDAHTPSGFRMANGMYRLTWPNGTVHTAEAYQRCYRFVVDTALALAADDFTFDAWAVRQAAGGLLSWSVDMVGPLEGGDVTGDSVALADDDNDS